MAPDSDGPEMMLKSLADELSRLLEHPPEGGDIKQAIRDAYNRHAADLGRFLQEQHKASFGRETALLVRLIFHLERSLLDSEQSLHAAALQRVHKRLQIVKDQMKDCAGKMGFSWRDPRGEPFTPELADLVEVDGWRHAGSFRDETVAETREPIVLRDGKVVLIGAVVVGAPDTNG